MIVRLAAVLLFAGAMHAASAPDWVSATLVQPLPAQPPRTEAVVLSDVTTVAFTPSGELTTRRRRVVKILTPAGLDYAYGAAYFDDRTKLVSMRGWTIDPSGKVQVVRERHALESTAATFEVFTDAKVKVLDLRADVGATVAYEYETRGTPYEPVTIWRFQEHIPVLHARLEARVPGGWTHAATWVNHETVEPQPGLVWELRNLEGIADEPRMPEPYTVAGWMGVRWNGARAWSDVAQWFARLAAPRAVRTPALQARAQELAKEAADPIRALARFAQRDVRYVAIAIGIGGYQPHAAGDVFANRYGDCKDKATLLKTMLAELGVASHFVLVNTTRGAVHPDFASIHAFDHVISAIRIPREQAKGLDAVVEHPQLGTLLLFDPTSTTTPFGELPWYLQASRGLLVTDDGGELIDLPAHAPESNELRRTAKLTLQSDGTLAGTVEEVHTGTMAASLRARLQPLGATERIHVIDSGLAHHLARHTASNVTIENIDDPEKDLVIRFAVSARNYAVSVADMVLVRPRVLGTKPESIGGAAERKLRYVTDGPSLHTDAIEIAIPESLALDELPPQVDVATPYVDYTSQSSFADGVLRYTRRYAMKVYEVGPAELVDLASAFAKVAADERASAVFK